MSDKVKPRNKDNRNKTKTNKIKGVSMRSSNFFATRKTLFSGLFSVLHSRAEADYRVKVLMRQINASSNL